MGLRASIDIGTNSTRLLLGDISSSGLIKPVLYREKMTKLGAGLTASGHLDDTAIHKVIEVLLDYKQQLSRYNVEAIHVFATSAAREARNQSYLLDLIYTRTGYRLRILTGEEEAQLSFWGAISDANLKSTYVVCDIGGGSSEFIYGHGRQYDFVASLNIGSGRLTRQFLHNEPPKVRNIDRLLQHVRAQLGSGLQHRNKPADLIAVGGTAATLAMMAGRIPIDQPLRAHHLRLDRKHLTFLIDTLSQMDFAAKKDLIGLDPQRADIILAGALIFSEIMDYFESQTMVISLRDLLFGILIEEIER